MPCPTSTLPDALAKTLCELGRVDRLAELGTNGPLLASAGPTACSTACSVATRCVWRPICWRIFPSVAARTLLDLARLQGVRHNPRGEEEPGRILHEFRAPDDPHAIRLAAGRLGLSVLRRRRRHAAVGQPAGRVLRAAGHRHPRRAAHRPPVALDHRPRQPARRAGLDRRPHRRPDRRRLPLGAPRRAARHPEPGLGRLVRLVLPRRRQPLRHPRPYAPVAVQGYAYDALMIGADLLERSPGLLPFDAEWLRGRAWRLREQVLEPVLAGGSRHLCAGDDGRGQRPASAGARGGVQRRAPAGQQPAGRPRRGRASRQPDRALLASPTCWAAPAFGPSRPARRASAPAPTTTARSGRWTAA